MLNEDAAVLAVLCCDCMRLCLLRFAAPACCDAARDVEPVSVAQPACSSIAVGNTGHCIAPRQVLDIASAMTQGCAAGTKLAAPSPVRAASRPASKWHASEQDESVEHVFRGLQMRSGECETWRGSGKCGAEMGAAMCRVWVWYGVCDMRSVIAGT